MSQGLFEGALVRERKRADRANAPLALLLVTVVDRSSVDAPLWDAVVDAMAAAKRETDLLGWIRPQAALGVIVTDIRAPSHVIASLLEQRIRCGLSQRLSTATANRFSIRLHVHPEQTAAEPGTLPPVEPLLEDIRSRTDRPAVFHVVKRGVDVVGSVTLLAVLSPLLLLIAALIKLRSPGPVLFEQPRIGQKARPFAMLKFRTMRVDADDGIHQAFVTDLINGTVQARERAANGIFKIADDPRVTRLGSILRKTSLDELPQLWNVLRGEMSLVGPRPPLPYEVDQYQSWHRRRLLDAKPGITGLWQVAGRSRTTFDEMVRLDLRYARTRSLWTDVKILLATPAAVISGKGAG